jgi:Predicted phosphoesterase
MRIAVLSDIHANLYALESVIADIKSRNVDSYVFLGDLVMTGSRPKEVYELVKELNPMVWIKGNTDGWIDEINNSFVPQNDNEKRIVSMFEYSKTKLDESSLSTIREKPISIPFVNDGFTFLFCHGNPNSYSEGVKSITGKDTLNQLIQSYPFDYMICGHTHKRMCFTILESNL